jgi:hypothetical protein
MVFSNFHLHRRLRAILLHSITSEIYACTLLNVMIPADAGASPFTPESFF